MKQEIISVHLGDCGVRLGDKFLELLAYDHGITPIGTYWESNPSQTSKINVFFNATKTNSRARLFCADLDKRTFNRIENSTYRKLYEPNNLLFGADDYDTGSNYATGYYSQKSRNLLKSLKTVMCGEAEMTDSLQGFQMIHSLGGGIGSGFGSLLFQNITETYPKQLISTFTVIPSQWLSNNPLESYNFILSIPALKEFTHYNILLDNESTCNILIRDYHKSKPLINDVNHIMAHAITGITTTLRFPTEINETLTKFYNNMVPRKDLHLLLPSITPIPSVERVPFEIPTESSLAYELFRSKNCLAEVDLFYGKILAMASVFRGPMNLEDINKFMTIAKKQNSLNFSNWISGNVKCGMSVISTKGLPNSATSVMNSSAIKDIFRRIEQRYISNMKRKYMIHYYTDQGMDEDEFNIAYNTMINWMDNYVDYSKNILIKKF